MHHHTSIAGLRAGALATLLGFTLAAAACGGAASTSTGPGAPAAGATAPSTGLAALLNADGTRVAAEVLFQGACAPAGSRGGCHTITLRPDGSYRNFLYDAAIDGTYTIERGVVRLIGPDAGGSEELTLSADGTRLGDMVRQP